MKASELRIGNWVTAPKGALYNGYDIQWSENEFVRCVDGTISYNQFKPIPPNRRVAREVWV